MPLSSISSVKYIIILFIDELIECSIDFQFYVLYYIFKLGYTSVTSRNVSPHVFQNELQFSAGTTTQHNIAKLKACEFTHR